MNLLYERNNEHSEKYLQQKVINNLDLQKIILEKLEIDFNTAIKFTKGKTYANRILPDVKVARGNEILALIECKGAKINVTDYVRGIGQLLQYEYFWLNLGQPKFQAWSFLDQFLLSQQRLQHLH